MRVKYIGKREVDVPNSYRLFMDLLPGKIYKVISIEDGWYRLIDESGEDYLYPPDKFKIIDDEPPAPVL